jgi:hypothetical protein
MVGAGRFELGQVCSTKPLKTQDAQQNAMASMGFYVFIKMRQNAAKSSFGDRKR